MNCMSSILNHFKNETGKRTFSMDSYFDVCSLEREYYVRFQAQCCPSDTCVGNFTQFNVQEMLISLRVKKLAVS